MNKIFQRLHELYSLLAIIPIILIGVAAPANAFADPVITSISPSQGTIDGGTSITITGTNLDAGIDVQFDWNSSPAITVVDSTTLQVVTPSGMTAGPADVYMMNPDGTEFTLAGGFTYTVPTITSISPAQGTIDGGTTVTLTGTDFLPGSSVTFDGNMATSVTYISSTTLTAVTPTAWNAGPVDVYVSTPQGIDGPALTGGFDYKLPNITAINPGEGDLAGGTSVTLTGTDFVPGASVTFGGYEATSVTVMNSTTLTAVTPAGDNEGLVGVVTYTPQGFESNMFMGYSYGVAANPAPQLLGITPAEGSTAGGTLVTLSGNNFVAGATVTIGGASLSSVTVSDSSTLTGVTGAHTAGTEDLVVTNPDGQTATLLGAFSYQAPADPAPTVSAITPNQGDEAGDTYVTISGSGFQDGATVTVGDVALTGVSIAPTSITGTTGAGTAGVVDVVVTNPDMQSATLVGGYTYASPLPVGEPSITGISPTHGTVDGGTVVTISGADFSAGMEVDFGADPATTVTVVNSTTLTVVTPSTWSAGAVPVVVRTSTGIASLPFDSFTYTLPTITAISPAQGTVDGGTVVTLTGTDFLSGSGVTFDGNAATSVTYVNSTTLTAVTPTAWNAGPVDVYVNTPQGTEGPTLTGGFEYKLPNITAISPAEGSIDGGTTVTLTGTDFMPGSGVTFGGNAAIAVAVVNSNTMTAVTPAGGITGPVSVEVQTAAGFSSSVFADFTYVVPTLPVITAISPAQGSVDGGTTVTLTGTDFVSGSGVIIGGNAATSVTVVDSATITAVTPISSKAGPVDVYIKTPQDNNGPALTGGFEYKVPVITAISPSEGELTGGTTVTLTGADFLPGSSVTFGGNAATAVTFVNSSTLTTVTPARTSGGLVDVTINTPLGFGSSSFSGFFYEGPAPTISTISPNTATVNGGVAVTITGTDFQPGASVSIGGAALAAARVVNGTTIAGTAPVHAVGTYDVVVTNPDIKSATLTGAFIYTYVPPLIGAVSPASGPDSGGSSITITGSGFQAGTGATVGGVPLTGLTVTATSITGTTGAHAAGTVNVVVSNPDGQSATKTGAYTYMLPTPQITSVSPNTGPSSGGTPITISGINFLSGATVSIGGSVATAVTVVNTNTITATTTAHTGGLVDVMVTNPDNQVARLDLSYSYALACDSSVYAGTSAPTISITSPSQADTIIDASVLVTGIFTGPDNTGITVNGVQAITEGNNFYANNVPLLDGFNTLTAVATTVASASASASVDVTRAGTSVVDFSHSEQRVSTSDVVSFDYSYAGVNAIASLDVDFDGDGVTDLASATSTLNATTTYIASGLYRATMTATDVLGNVYSDVYVIKVDGPYTDDSQFQEHFSAMRMALNCGDVNAALSYISISSRDRYQPALEALAPHLADIMATWSPLQQSRLATGYAEFGINRMINGVNRLFIIYFVEDEDGVWRIKEM